MKNIVQKCRNRKTPERRNVLEESGGKEIESRMCKRNQKQ